MLKSLKESALRYSYGHSPGPVPFWSALEDRLEVKRFKATNLMLMDVRGFSKLVHLGRGKPEAVFGLMNTVWEIVLTILADHQAEVNNFIGDAALVFRGVYGVNGADREEALLSKTMVCAEEISRAFSEDGKVRNSLLALVENCYGGESEYTPMVEHIKSKNFGFRIVVGEPEEAEALYGMIGDANRRWQHTILSRYMNALSRAAAAIGKWEKDSASSLEPDWGNCFLLWHADRPRLEVPGCRLVGSQDFLERELVPEEIPSGFELYQVSVEDSPDGDESVTEQSPDDHVVESLGMGTNSSTASFSWLHLSDLHYGHNKPQFWPTVNEAIKKDLRYVVERSGPWDVVVFTGDLVQRGNDNLYTSFTKVLDDWWAFFRSELKCDPVLVTIPGNHDLVWQDSADTGVQQLLQYCDDESIRDEFWSPSGALRSTVEQAFESYSQWELKHTLPRPHTVSQGLLPGDRAWVVESKGFRVGIVGLNSSFLQLVSRDKAPSGSDPDEPFKERLALDVRQLHEACGGNAVQWLEENCDFALLLTHHPPSWLCPDALDEYRSEINVPGRFVAHLFGHMHAHKQQALSEGGAEVRHSWQGTSLFGLETWGGKTHRKHGYTAGRIELVGDQALVRLWPRVTHGKQAGHRELIADPTATLDPKDDGTFPVSVMVKPRTGV